MDVYVILVFRCTFFYFVITALLRIMGKREVGELSVFDIVVYFVMSELLAISISDPNEDMLKTLIPIVTLTILQVSLSWLMMKMQKVRNIVDGRPVFIITHGKLNIEEMLSKMNSKMLLDGLNRISKGLSPEQLKMAEAAIKSTNLKKELQNVNVDNLQKQLQSNPDILKELMANKDLMKNLENIVKNK